MNSNDELAELENRILYLEFEALRNARKADELKIEALVISARFPNVLQHEIVNGRTVYLFQAPGKKALECPQDLRRWPAGLREIKKLRNL